MQWTTLIASLWLLASLTLATAQQNRPSVEELKPQLLSKSGPVRLRTLTKLADLGADGVPATAGVETLLKSEVIEERLAAAAVLICFDPKRYDERIEAIRDALRAKDARSRSAALGALRLIRPAATKEYAALIASLFSSCSIPGRSEDQPFAVVADSAVLRAISAEFGPPPKDVVPALAQAMADPNPTVRHVADCLLWPSLEAGHADPATTFLPLLTHKSGVARISGVKALARCPTVPDAVLAAVADSLSDPDTRPYAIEILVRAGPAALVHLPAMQKGVEDPLERAWLAARLDPGTHGAACAELIGKRIDERSAKSQLDAVELRRLSRMLEPLGPLAKSAAPALVRNFGDSTRDAVAAIGAAAVPELRALLRDPERKSLYLSAVRCLQEIGLVAREAVPELVALLATGIEMAKPRGFLETTPGDHLLLALIALGPDAARPEVLKALKKRLQEPEGDQLVALQMMVSLGQLGPKAKVLAPVLAELASKKDDGAGFIALTGLIAIDFQHPAVGKALVALDKDKSSPLAAMLELPVSLAGGFDRRTLPAPDSGDALIQFFKTHPERQAPAREWTREWLDKKPTDESGPWACPIWVPAALAHVNPADLPLALKVLERALEAGDPRALVVIRRLGPSAKPLAPAVKRFVDQRPSGLACRGEGETPDEKGKAQGRTGECMFCAPSDSAAPGLVSPPEPFLPGKLKAPVYESSSLRLFAADTLKTITDPKK